MASVLKTIVIEAGIDINPHKKLYSLWMIVVSGGYQVDDGVLNTLVCSPCKMFFALIQDIKM